MLGVLFATVVSWPLLNPHRLFAGLDTVAYTAPNDVVSYRALRHWQLPGWNPYIFGGAPHLANPQVALFYPLKLPFLWLEPYRAISLLALLHLVLMALGMVVLLGAVIDLRTPAPLVGAMALVGSGFVLLQMVNVEQLWTITWAPWLLAAVDATLTGKVAGRRGTVLIALAFGLMLLAGHQEPVYYVLAFVAAWVIGRVLESKSLARVELLVAGLALGSGLAAVQLVPTALLVERSVRSRGVTPAELGLPERVLHLRELPARVLGDIFAPSVVVKPGLGAIVYLGAAVTALGLLGLVWAARRAEPRPSTLAVAIAAAVGALLAAGPRTIIYRLAYRLIPGVNLLRAPGRWVVVIVISASYLAALGTDAVLRRDISHRDWLVAAGVALVFCLAIVFGPLDAPPLRTLLIWLAATGGVVVACAGIQSKTIPIAVTIVLVALPALELGSLARASPAWVLAHRRSELRKESAVTRFLVARKDRGIVLTAEKTSDVPYLARALRPNVNATLAVRSLDGYDGGAAITRRWAGAMESLTTRQFDPRVTLREQLREPLDAPLFARFGVGWALIDDKSFSPKKVVPGWRGPIFRNGSFEVWENPAYVGDAFLYSRTVIATTNVSTSMRSLGADLNSAAIVEEKGLKLECQSHCGRVPVTSVRPRPERILLRETAERKSLLVVAEQWDPGWRASVDGQIVRPVPVDGFMIGIPLERGPHKIQLNFRTQGLRAGLATSVASLIVAGLLAGSRLRRRGMPRRTQHATKMR